MHFSKTTISLLAFLCGVFVAIPAAQAATITVTSESGGTGGPDCTLRDAITAANTDTATGGCVTGNGADTIELPVDATITLTEPDNDTDGPNGLPSIISEVSINGNWSIVERDGADDTPEFRIFFVAADGGLTLENLTVSNGLFETARYGTTGGGILSVGSLTLTDSTVSGNTADSGGGIFAHDTLILIHSTVSGNSSGTGNGGGILSVGSLTLTDSTVSGNTSNEGGGGIYSFGSLTLTDSTVSGNDGGEYGGGIFNEGVLTMTDTTLSNNAVSGFGGGILNVGTAAATNSTFIGNVDNFHGGGIANGGTFMLINSTISGNVDNGNGGGGIWIGNGELTLTNSTVCGNQQDQIVGNYTDGGGNLIADECPLCLAADFDGDGIVNATDLATLLGSWGPCEGCSADLDGNGQVGPFDLALLLGNWGPCP